MLKRLVAPLIAATFGILILASCDRLEQADTAKATSIDRDITAIGKTLDTARSNYTAIQGNAEEWAFFAAYAENEDWAGKFDEAASSLASLRSRYDSEIKPILEANKSEDTARLRQLLNGISDNFAPVRDEIKWVKARMDLLREGFEKAPNWIADARSFSTQVDELTAAAATQIAAAKEAFPERAADIDQRFAAGNGQYAGLGKLQSDVAAALVAAEAEFAKHDSGQDADYAAFADAYTATKDGAAAATEASAAYLEDLASLYKGGSTILADMKVEYDFIIGRTTWDNYFDFPTEHPHEYPAVRATGEQGQADYLYLTGLPQGEGNGAQGNLAVSDNRGRGTVHIDNAVWNRLGINPTDSWARGDDEGVFWIEDLAPVYYHKYTEVVNGEQVTGDWVEVDEAEFGLHADSFGMEIYSKRVGQFNDEAIEEAIPPGLDKVGDERYGRWEGTGADRQWSWLETYAFYHLMFGGNNVYYYNDYNNYNGWRRDRRANPTNANTWGYYGNNRATPTYGSRGTATVQSASYRNSPFARTGGVSSVPKSVRDAGATARSRGPGGRGK